MRILHVAEAFGGGVFEVVKHLSARQAIAGHRVAVAYGRRPETPDELSMGLHPAVVAYPLPWRSRQLMAHLKTAAALRRLIGRWHPDIIHLHSSFATVVGAAVAPRNIARISTPHAYSFTMGTRGRTANAALRALELVAARGVDLVGAVSSSEAEIARTSLGIRKVAVVRNGIPELDAGAAPVRSSKSPSPLVVAMGRAEAQRRPEECAQILAGVRDIADVEWIGGMSTSSMGETVLAQHGIKITGWLPRDAALDRLGQARAYLHWTAWDGQPLSVLEAMARDVVVVASDIPPNREILGDTQVCATPQEAVALLRELLTDTRTADEMLARQQAVRGAYGADRMAVDWLAVYERVIRR